MTPLPSSNIPLLSPQDGPGATISSPASQGRGDASEGSWAHVVDNISIPSSASLPFRIFAVPLSALDSAAALITAAAIAEAVRGVHPFTETLLYFPVFSALDMVRRMASATQVISATVPQTFVGHICERCFDAMATVWVPATDLEDELGVCVACNRKGV